MKLNVLRLNDDNPRKINDARFNKLFNSIIEFPKMLSLRPIIYDDQDNNNLLGGNMRFRVLQKINKLGREKFLKILEKSNLQDNINAFESVLSGLVPDEWIKPASSLTDDEKKKFIILDNVEFGSWDHELLSKSWDAKTLDKMGVEKEYAGYFQKQTGETEKFNDFKMPYPITIVVTKEEYEEWERLKSEYGENNDLKLFKKVLNK
jgi:hypothetical protein